MTKVSHREPCEYALLQSMGYPTFLPLAGISSIDLIQQLFLFNRASSQYSKMFPNSFNNNTNCQNTTNSYNTVSNYSTVGDDLSLLLSWVSPLDPGLRHWDIQGRRVGNVGEWLMGTEEFKRWCRPGGGGDNDGAVLFCYGNPGVEKTFIRWQRLCSGESSGLVLTGRNTSLLVVDKLCEQTRGENTPVTCFCFDFAARKEQTATSMLGSILKQVINGTERILEDIWRALVVMGTIMLDHKMGGMLDHNLIEENL